ncbi:MAG: MBL fold metallo-hydrolase [Candidatus Planktophila sp.]|nr:MBL fold metallo-hydrolase [Candidatus Planktophila sp.]
MSDVTITFLGATETVTGSRFLVTTSLSKILVDCGMFQGTKEIRKKNWEAFPVDVKTIDAVVLTHAHLDHCGYLPLLVRQGYRNPIHSTHYTNELATIILRDSAHLQELDAKFAAEKKYSEYLDPKPLYGSQDVEATLKLFSEHQFRISVQITQDVTVTFFPSGHILGSSFIVLKVGDKTILFTSDLGRDNHPILSVPDKPPASGIDAVVTESTYGDRVHDTTAESFANEINAGIKRGGKILIPAFAVDRTEVILMALRALIEEKKIPSLPIYVDSPMAIAALELYRRAIAENSQEIRPGVSQQWSNQDPFDAGALKQLATTEDSKSLKDQEGIGVLIAASGMSSGGRVVHHLKNLLPDEKNTVILVGFQASGTRGRQLEDGQKAVKIHGGWIPVNAHICKVESFSVHADSDELILWLGQISKPTNTFIVHGEADSQATMKSRIEKELGWKATIPKSSQVFTV